MKMGAVLVRDLRSHLTEYILWIVGFIMILICLLRMASPVKRWDFEAEELCLNGDGLFFESGMVDGNVPGWYVDNGMEYGEVFVTTPEIELPVGSYEVTLRYQTNADGSRYSFQSRETTYRVSLGRDNVGLDAGRRKLILQNFYWMPEEGFQVSIAYGGSGYLIVNSISIKQTRALEHAMLFLCVVMLGGCIGYLRFRGRINEKMWWTLGIAFAAQLPFLCMYLYKGDDLWFHLLRIEGGAKGLASGQFPVRIQPVWMNGYGYPVSVFYSDGILMIAQFLRFIGFPLQSSYKIYVFVIHMITYFIAEYSIERLLGEKKIAFMGGVLYTLAPYRLLNIYDRAAVGEYTAMAFLPLVFVGAYEILMIDRKACSKSWLVLAAGMTGIIQSHVLTCEIVVFILGITCAFFWKRFLKKDRLLDIGKAIVITVLVNLWFVIPFLDYFVNESFHINSDNSISHIQTMGTSLSQLLDLFPRSLGRIVSISEGMSAPESSQAIGIVFIIGMFVFIYECHVHKKWPVEWETGIKLGKYCMWLGIILLGMTTIWFPWDFISGHLGKLGKMIVMIQFPWRLLSIASFVFTVLTCVAVKGWTQYERKGQVELGIILLGIAGCSAGGYFSSVLAEKDAVYVPDTELFGTFETIGGEYLMSGVDAAPEYMPEDTLWSGDGITVTDHEKNGTNYRLSIINSSPEMQYVELPMIYYRGYQANDPETGEKILLDEGENGRIRICIDGGYQGTVSVRFQEPVGWRISEVISVVSVVAVGIYLIRQYRKRQSGQRNLNEA